MGDSKVDHSGIDLCQILTLFPDHFSYSRLDLHQQNSWCSSETQWKLAPVLENKGSLTLRMPPGSPLGEYSALWAQVYEWQEDVVRIGCYSQVHLRYILYIGTKNSPWLIKTFISNQCIKTCMPEVIGQFFQICLGRTRCAHVLAVWHNLQVTSISQLELLPFILQADDQFRRSSYPWIFIKNIAYVPPGLITTTTLFCPHFFSQQCKHHNEGTWLMNFTWSLQSWTQCTVLNYIFLEGAGLCHHKLIIQEV